jgi:hypothetical protein
VACKSSHFFVHLRADICRAFFLPIGQISRIIDAKKTYGSIFVVFLMGISALPLARIVLLIRQLKG